jgi:hypothetical protein
MICLSPRWAEHTKEKKNSVALVHVRKVAKPSGTPIRLDNSIETPGFTRKPPHIRKFCRNPLTALAIGKRSFKVGCTHFALALENEGFHTQGVTVRVVPGAKTRRELKQREWNGQATGVEKTKTGNYMAGLIYFSN